MVALSGSGLFHFNQVVLHLKVVKRIWPVRLVLFGLNVGTLGAGVLLVGLVELLLGLGHANCWTDTVLEVKWFQSRFLIFQNGPWIYYRHGLRPTSVDRLLSIMILLLWVLI